MREREALRVLVVEDHELTRRGLVHLLREDGIEVVGETGSPAVARQLATGLSFDVAVVAAGLGGGGEAFALVRHLRDRRPSASVVMLAATDDAEELLDALRAGAVGYLGRQSSMARLGASLRAVARGEAVLSRELTLRVIGEFRELDEASRRTRRELPAPITRREWEVLKLLADGRSTAEVARDLFISIETVRTHVKSTLRKLGVRNRAGAVAYVESMRPAYEAFFEDAASVA
jgi:DNA-binding NarL/FixJ family response regulator